MQFYSTNRKTSPVSLREAVVRGLATDRGLFMPEVIRRFPPAFYQRDDLARNFFCRGRGLFRGKCGSR